VFVAPSKTSGIVFANNVKTVDVSVRARFLIFANGKSPLFFVKKTSKTDITLVNCLATQHAEAIYYTQRKYQPTSA
jgi:hypothetical protein